MVLRLGDQPDVASSGLSSVRHKDVPPVKRFSTLVVICPILLLYTLRDGFSGLAMERIQNLAPHGGVSNRNILVHTSWAYPPPSPEARAGRIDSFLNRESQDRPRPPRSVARVQDGGPDFKVVNQKYNCASG